MTAPYYADESVNLYHGDCREVTDWLAADVLVTDPPYGMGYVQWQINTAPVPGDPMPKSRASDRVSTRADVALRDSALDLWGRRRPAIIFGSWRAPKPVGTQMRLVWDKVFRSPGGVGVWRHSDEEIYLRSWPNPRGLAATEASVVRFRTLRGDVRPDHPTPKPLSLMEYLLRHSPPGVIADPFVGSGSTLVAAKRLGRKSVGVEIEERYCELAAQRLSQGVLDFDEVPA